MKLYDLQQALNLVKLQFHPETGVVAGRKRKLGATVRIKFTECCVEVPHTNQVHGAHTIALF